MTKDGLIEKMKALKEQMLDVAADMDFFGGFGEIRQHGLELAGAAGVLQTWIDGIESEKEAA